MDEKCENLGAIFYICPFLILLWCDVYQMMPTKNYFVSDPFLIDFSKQMKILMIMGDRQYASIFQTMKFV